MQKAIKLNNILPENKVSCQSTNPPHYTTSQTGQSIEVFCAPSRFGEIVSELAPITLEPKHYLELEQSAIAPDVMALNFTSLEGERAVDLICGDKKWERLNNRQLTAPHLRLWNAMADGGWFCGVLDADTLEDSPWGCFKPDKPRQWWEDEKGKKHSHQESKADRKHKAIKYEHPEGVATEAFILKVSRHQWRQIAGKAGIECPDLMAITNDDVPKAFWQWAKDNPTLKIIITEGAKKTASLLSHGYVAIGLPGIYSGYRAKDGSGLRMIKPKLIPQLEAFCQRWREFVFCFDNDTKPATIKNVRIAIGNTARILRAKDCSVSVMEWSELAEKGIDDVIFAHGEDKLNDLFKHRTRINKWKLELLSDLSDLVTLKVNSRYLNESVPTLPDDRLICIKSPKGSGKTELLSAHVQDAIAKGKRVFVLLHREQLAKELAERFGLPYRTERADTGHLLGYTLCVDSLHPKANPPFNADDHEGCMVIIDEADQVIWHLLNSSTCKDTRAAILRQLTTLIDGASQIILADADLTRISIEYIQGLMIEPATPYVILNEHQKEIKTPLYVFNEREELFTKLKELIRNGDRLMIHTGGQKEEATWGTQNLESMLASLFPDKKILRIDGKSATETGHPAEGCMSNLNEVLGGYDIVIASPTIETGVSIDGKIKSKAEPEPAPPKPAPEPDPTQQLELNLYGTESAPKVTPKPKVITPEPEPTKPQKTEFDAVFCFASGSQTTMAVCQALARVRANAPRYIWITDNAPWNKVGCGSDDPYAMIQTEDKILRVNQLLLWREDASANYDGLNPQHLKTWATMAAKHNLGFQDYYGEILSQLKKEGYVLMRPDLTLDPDQSLEEIKEEVKANSKRLHFAKCEAIANAPLLDDLAYQKIKKQRAKTKPERLSESKTAISRRYATEDVTPDLVNKDSDFSWYGKLRLHYFATVGIDHLPTRDKNAIDALSKADGAIFTPDLNRACLGTKIKALKLIGIDDLLTPGKTFTNEGLAQWHDHVVKYRRDIKIFLGVSISENKTTRGSTATDVLSRLLRRCFGLKLKCVAIDQSGGTKTRTYVIAAPTDDRGAIFARWEQRDLKNEAEKTSNSIRSLSIASDVFPKPNLMSSQIGDRPICSQYNSQ